MSFLGGVRWADLSSDTHSLTAAPPFGPGFDDDPVAPSPSGGGGPTPHSTAFTGQARKRRGHQNASDTTEALLLQCDAAAEQSYLNPSSAAELACSNAGMNLHFREAARLGCSTPVDEEMGEAADPLGMYAARGNAGNASPRARVDASAVRSDAEGGREQRLSNNSAQQHRVGQATAVNNRRGRGSASGGGSVCAGFKGLLASTNSATGGSDGVAVSTRKPSNSCRPNSSASTHTSIQQVAATQGRRLLGKEVLDRTEPLRGAVASTSGSFARKSGSCRAGDKRGGAHHSTDSASAVEKAHQKVSAAEESSPGGWRRNGDAKGTGRRRDAGKGEREQDEHRDPGPDASDNWRSTPTTRERAEAPVTDCCEQAASRADAPTAAPALCSREPQPQGLQLAASASPAGKFSLLKQIVDAPLVSAELSAHDGHEQQQQPPTAFAAPTRVQHQQQQHSRVSSDAAARQSREKDGRQDPPHLATRMMTPAKRHRPPAVAEGPEGGFPVLRNSGECATAEAPAAEEGKNSVSAKDGTEDAAGNASSVKAGHDVPAARAQNSRVPSGEKCNSLSGAVAEFSTSAPHLHGLQSTPPRKKKRGATAETGKRLSAETLTATGVNNQSGEGITAASEAAATSATVPSPHPSNGTNFLHGEHQQRRSRGNSFVVPPSAAAVRGRRRSKAGTGGKTGEEHVAPEHDSIRHFPGSTECAAPAAAIASPTLLQFAAQACPLVPLPGACFATPPYIMVPVAAATPLTAVRRSSNDNPVPVAAVHSAAVVCGATAAGKKSQKREQHKPAATAAGHAAKQSDSVAASQENDEEAEQEWARRASARMKDIAVGKATEGYKNFIRIVPKDKRRAGDPATPDPKQRCSKAKFQRELLDWRKQLHRYDGCCPAEEYSGLPDNSCSSSGGTPAELGPEIDSHACIPPGAGGYGCIQEHCSINVSCDGANVAMQSRDSSSSSTGGSSIAVPLFSTPTGSGEQAAGGAGALVPHPDPIEQFNRECERAWL